MNTVAAYLRRYLALIVLGSAALLAQPPAPDPESLIKAVVANQKQLEETRKNYIFHRQDEEQDLDDNGNLKKTTVSEYEVFFVGPWEIDHLLKLRL